MDFATIARLGMTGHPATYTVQRLHYTNRYWLIDWLIDSLTHSLIYSFIYLFIYLFIMNVLLLQ